MGYVHSYACLVQIDETEILATGIVLKDLNLFIDYTQLDSSSALNPNIFLQDFDIIFNMVLKSKHKNLVKKLKLKI